MKITRVASLEMYPFTIRCTNSLSTVIAYFLVIADNDFLLTTSFTRNLIMLTFLYVPVLLPYMLVVSVLKHLLGGHQKLSNAEKDLKH